jgi:hypothetical protein
LKFLLQDRHQHVDANRDPNLSFDCVDRVSVERVLTTADGRVQPHGVVMINEALKSSAILLGKRAAWPETIGFEALVPSLDFTVGMGRELHLMRRMQNSIFE